MAAVVTTVSTEKVMITSTLSDSQSVCRGQRVNFTCVIRGSSIISWISNEYIDAGGTSIEFVSADDIGVSRQLNPNAVATLVSTEVINGTQVLTSQLMIRVTSIFSYPSVICLPDDHLMNKTTTFTVQGIMHVRTCILCVFP